MKIKGNVEVLSATSRNNNIARTINGLSPDVNGNIDINVEHIFTGESGETVTFSQNNLNTASMLVTLHRIITLDNELEECKNIQITDGNDNNIYDSRTGEVWVYDGAWSISSTLNMYSTLKKGSIISNLTTKVCYIINENNTVSTVSGFSKGNESGQVPGVDNFLFSTTNSCQILPSGLIMQWVSGSTNSSGIATITLPQPLTTTILAVKADFTNTAAIIGYDKSLSTNTQITFKARIISSSSVSTGVVSFRALVIGY